MLRFRKVPLGRMLAISSRRMATAPPTAIPVDAHHAFATTRSGLDRIKQTTLQYGDGLVDPDPLNPHPSFADPVYRARRQSIADLADGFRNGDEMPLVEYTELERATWRTLFDRLDELHPTHACSQYLVAKQRLLADPDSGFYRDRVPDMRKLNRFLEKSTGFTLRPAKGLLSSREFLNALSLRVFFCTQFLRHHSQPLFSVEPDMCHEVFGHIPMFADPDFARFSETIGVASLGASEETILRLSRLYWFTVEWGLCKEPNGEVRAFGAALLGGAADLVHALSETPVHLAFDVEAASTQDYPLTELQPLFFVTESFQDATAQLERYAASLR